MQKVSGAAVLRSHQVPYDVRRTLDRALPGVYFLIKASVLRCWAVALDIKASVNCLGIYVFFSRTFLMRYFLLSIVCRGI